MEGTVVVKVDGLGQHVLRQWGGRVYILDDVERLEGLAPLVGRVSIVLTPIGHKGKCEICDGLLRKLIGEPGLTIEFPEGLKEVEDETS